MKLRIALGFVMLVACTVAGQIGVKLVADRLGVVRPDAGIREGARHPGDHG